MGGWLGRQREPGVSKYKFVQGAIFPQAGPASELLTFILIRAIPGQMCACPDLNTQIQVFPTPPGCKPPPRPPKPTITTKCFYKGTFLAFSQAISLISSYQPIHLASGFSIEINASILNLACPMDVLGWVLINF